MRVAFRVDASILMGGGHTARCLALAGALREKGVNCHFVQRAQAGHIAARIRQEGFDITLLPRPERAEADADVSDWLGVSQARDAAETLDVLRELAPDWLVVDHYALGAQWEHSVRPSVGGIVAVDDLADRAHRCDVLLDQNHFADASARYEDLIPGESRCLLGPRYALLRPEYAVARDPSGPGTMKPERVFVYYGGSDPTNETARAVRVLSRSSLQHLAAEVVVGAGHPDPDGVRRSISERGNAKLYAPRRHLADLMSATQFALGAGGVTAWERCTLGLPSVVTTVADNQVAPSEALAAFGATVYAGDRTRITDDDLAQALQHLIENPCEHSRIALRAWTMTDGLGAKRTAEVLVPEPEDRLRLRSAHENDKFLYFDWVNDPDVRQNAHNPEPISWNTHDAWFEGKLKDPNSFLAVLETRGGLPLGQFRVDVSGSVGVIDYSIDSAFRGRGLGCKLLDLGVVAWKRHNPDMPLRATVLANNLPSVKAFLKVGFRERNSWCDEVRRFSLP
jgi:UDP-2,4-diacetamido-2,4,6-trideoxy-beta-L-altropyranose hydrolase